MSWIVVSDDLVISGGGSVAVATDELFSQQQRLRALAEELDRCLAGLHSIDRLAGRAGSADVPPGLLRAERAIDDASATARSARDLSGFLASALGAAAAAYGEVERAEARLAQQFSAAFAYQLGLWMPTLAMVVAPSLLVAGVTVGGPVAIGYLLTPEAERREAVRRLLQANKGILSDPGFVGFLRLAVSSVDDLGDGLIRMPPELEQLLGDEGLGVLGLGSSAATVVAASRSVGALVETPVSVTAESTTRGGAPPAGYAERAQRIPTGGSQIRIDRYTEAGQPDRFEVYLGGTIDTSLVATDEPWDMTSNVTAIAGESAGSYEAARRAMALAGIDSSTPVVFSGYSQGGLLAAMLASSGEYDTGGLFTLGAPAGQVEVPHDIPYVAIEHSNDLIPAIGGVWKSSEPVIVTRDLFAGEPYAGELVLPAHELTNYQETAALADGSDERRLVSAGGRLRRFGDGAESVSTTLYRAERRPAE